MQPEASSWQHRMLTCPSALEASQPNYIPDSHFQYRALPHVFRMRYDLSLTNCRPLPTDNQGAEPIIACSRAPATVLPNI